VATGNTSAPAQDPAGGTVARRSERGPGRLAAWCYDHRRRVLAGWVLAVVVMLLAFGSVVAMGPPDRDHPAGGLACTRPTSRDQLFRRR
jgi:hypothetical protein